MGETINQALKRAQPIEEKGYRYSYDMLGEGARTTGDALKYLSSYQEAMKRIGETVKKTDDIYERPSLSVKLSALHPRYEWAQKQRVFAELIPVLLDLCERAKKGCICLTIDAEESERLELSLELIRPSAKLGIEV